MKKILLSLGFLVGCFWSAPQASAFTLIEVGPCVPAIANICAAPPNAEVAECCKCHKPCVDVGGASVINSAFINCVKNKEKCAPPPCPPPPDLSDCKVDADCNKDADPCTYAKCNTAAVTWICPDGTMTGGMVGLCGPELKIDNCPPPTEDCTKKYPLPGQDKERRCCKKGYDEALDPAAWKCCLNGYEESDPAKWKCCHENVVKNIDPGTPANPAPCPPDCPKCPPPPPVLKCEDIVDLKSRECCLKNGSIPLLVIDNCYDSAEKCKNELTINVGGDFTNTGCIQQCCDIKAGGDVSACNCLLGCPPGTPTTPSGSPAAALGTCAVTPASSDVIDGKEFAFGKDWIVTYTPPSGVGPVATAHLTKVGGVEITVDDPGDSATGGWIKTIADPSSLPPFSVHTARPPEMKTQEKEQAQFRVRVQLKDLANNELASMECDNAGFYEGMGGAGCGCRFGGDASPRDAGLFAGLVSLLVGILTVLTIGQRKRGRNRI